MIVKCPKCDSENVAPIYYGIQPDNNEIKELIDNNKIIYGGSIMLDDQPHEDYWLSGMRIQMVARFVAGNVY